MARIGTKRVKDVIDYERDIKGRGLVKLRAGVGAGKNSWVEELPKQYPQIQILLVTSRKNVATAQAYRLETDDKIHLSQLIDVEDKDILPNITANLIICNYAYLARFIEGTYDEGDPRTHLWNKFDVIFIDEAHALCQDAVFADSAFQVGRFIYHTRQKNPQCDVVLMSGTTEPIDWLFTEEHLGEYADIDIYDQCIHLVPDCVYLLKKEVVTEIIYKLWRRGERLIYFVTSVRGMAAMITQLKGYGVPEGDIGIAYSNGKNEESLPPQLVAEKDSIRDYLVKNQRLRADVKIFITTAQNKEGISIEDDDIKYVFSESCQKAELEQMAGRVRGNKETGTGTRVLGVVYDADNQWTVDEYLEQEVSKKSVDTVNDAMQQHEAMRREANKEFSLQKDIQHIEGKYPYLRYDYIGKRMEYYTAKEESKRQSYCDSRDLMDNVALYDDTLWYEIGADGNHYNITGRTLLHREWFPYSQVFLSPKEMGIPLEIARTVLLRYLQNNDFLGVSLTKEQQNAVMEEILRLTNIYGVSELGFKKPPQTLGPALKKFSMTLVRDHHHDTAKIEIGAAAVTTEQGT